MPLSVHLDAQSRATILAALAHYAATGQGDPARRTDLIHTLATDHDRQVSMDDTGIAYTFRLIGEAVAIQPHFGPEPMPEEPDWCGDALPDWGPVLAEAERAAGETLVAR